MIDLQCPICNTPYKYQTYEVNGYVSKIPIPQCDCEAKEQERMRKAEERATKLRYIESLHLPAIFAPFWLKNLECEHTGDAQIYVEGFRPRQSKGLFFCGSNGNGKSTLAAVICKELAYRGRRVLFTTMTEMLDRMEQGVGFNRAQQAQRTLKDLLSYDFIVFDDYGRENYTPLRLQNVFQIVDKLYTHRVPFCMTANPECIARIADIPEMAAINDRIGQVLSKWDFNRSSFRKEKD